MSTHTLDLFFNPSSIAVIGASRTPTKIGYETLKNVLVSNYHGKVYPVNPNASHILGLKCYPSVLALPYDVDLALITVPAKFVPKVILECGKKGVKGAIIISSGFSEIGEGKLEDEVLETARKYNVRILGPNTMGFKNATNSLDAAFVYGMPRKGNIALISQSGALSIGMIHLANSELIGLSKVVGTGNKIDIDDAELIRYFAHDSSTRVLAMYIEEIKNGEDFIKAVKHFPKPIVAIKAGKTMAGAKAISSHTGAMAGSDRIYNSVFKQTGIIRAHDTVELFDFTRALESQPSSRGHRIGIVTNGGGAGILLADACEENGLIVPPLTQKTYKKIDAVLPPLIHPSNPVDIVGDAGFYRYEMCSRALLEDSTINGLIITSVQAGYARPREFAGAIEKMIYEQHLHEEYDKPIIGCWIGGKEYEDLVIDLKRAGVPIYPSTTRAARAMWALVEEGKYSQGSKKNKSQ
jgi:acetyl coenzyme A synthetase (ADP forming)-like protein